MRKTAMLTGLILWMGSLMANESCSPELCQVIYIPESCMPVPCAPAPCSFGGFLTNSFSTHFEIEGSGLYWRTCRDDRVYAVVVDGIPGVTPSEVDFSIVRPEPAWGWRVKGTFAPETCYFIDTEYTFFNRKENATTNDPTTVVYFLNPVPTVQASIENDYQRTRTRAGIYLCDEYRGDVYAFGGAGWLYLKEKDKLNAPPAGGAVLSLSQKSQFTGAALEAGFGGDLRLFNRFYMLAEFNGVGAIGVRNYSFKLRSNGIGAPFAENIYPKETICIPGYDVRVELNYHFRCPCRLVLAVGYEHHQFFDALLLNPLFSSANIDPSLEPELLNLGFSGAYVTIRAGF